MRLSTNEIISSNNYKYYYKFNQAEGKLFLDEYIKKASIVTFLYYLFIIVTLIGLVFFAFLNQTGLLFVMEELGMAIILVFPSIFIFWGEKTPSSRNMKGEAQ